jgi:branched-chain amino acid transport system ATP-binding protein
MRAFSDLITTFRAEGRAVMLVDHNVKGVRALVDRVLAMYVGKKIAEGSPDEVMRDAKVRSVYLGGSLDEPIVNSAAGAVAKSAKPLLSVEAVSVRYGKAQALDKVSFEVHEGEFVSIAGLNGAGKTTLFNAISGFVSYDGDITWSGRSLLNRSPGAIARDGVVQCPESRELFGDMTVAENLGLGGQRLLKTEFEKQLAWLFELFPVLAERRRQTARTLSGGEQQMLAIGRALMMKPKLLILDEPTLGLAPVVLEHISQAIEVLRKETNITLVLGEQNVTFALKHSDRIYLLEHGQIVWQGDSQGFIREVGAQYL